MIAKGQLIKKDFLLHSVLVVIALVRVWRRKKSKQKAEKIEIQTFGNETHADPLYEELTGPSSRNHHSTSKECRGNFPARRGRPNNYATNELSFGL